MARMGGASTVIRLWGCKLHVNMVGINDWIRYYEELRGRAKNLRPVFERFGQYMVQGSIQRNFEAEGRPTKWAPLSPEYAKRKARLYPGKGILEATGAMRYGFEFQATAQTLKIDNAMFYWRFHQRGTPTLPQRTALILQRADKAVLTRWARDYLLGRTSMWR